MGACLQLENAGIRAGLEAVSAPGWVQLLPLSASSEHLQEKRENATSEQLSTRA
jgi:hypothetical protein